ncbi:hypothetical protein GGI19_002979 [Coemansia pectinata]|uniref:Uncharacterized protein n=1 Tax=Coemansia pectinata TaxID=1052879 RepID=A0A9W8GUY5_9FUNG|nr:hypothetical protein GGI19_002979 [Coemansia pectinata]
MEVIHIYPGGPSTPTWGEDNYDRNMHQGTLFLIIICVASSAGFLLLCTIVWCIIRKIRHRRKGSKPSYGNTWIVTQPPNLPFGQPWTVPAGQPWATTTEQSRDIAVEQSQITPANQPQTVPVDQPRTTSATAQM